MKTNRDFPAKRDPEERVPDEVVFWSRFPDVLGLWTALGWEPAPREVASD